MNVVSKFIQSTFALLIGLLLLVSFMLLSARITQGAVSNWQKGISLYPQANNDFASSTFQESLKNAKAININTATFIIPYYQTRANSTDIQSGWNTPTDQSLKKGIDYAHSLGLKVAIKLHLNPYYGDSWSANINPQDRTTWFNNYKKILNHYANIAEQTKTEQMIIGNEITQMTTETSYTENTTIWKQIISELRSRFKGQLTYNSNWGGCFFCDEKNHINFWEDLDVIGISGYFNLNDDMQNSWDSWNKSEIAPLAQKYNKPIVFTEIGYRSVDKAHRQPWNYTLAGSVNEQEQVDSYETMFNYWDRYPYMQGVSLWYWETNPNAGGPSDSNYTVQNKKAQETVKNWFSK